MYGSNWGKRFAAFLASTLGLGFVAFALIYGLSQQSHYLQAADNHAAEYSRDTAYQEKKACRGVPLAKLAQCRADAKSEYDQKRADNRREYDDLVAQQTSALWTSIMGIAAITGMVLSVIGVWLVYTTFRETKLANVIARQAASAAAKDAKQSRDALIAADRAIISVKSAEQDSSTDTDSDWTIIYFQLRNDGKSNAYGFQILFSITTDAIYRTKTRFSHNIDRICADGATIICPVKIRRPTYHPVHIIGFVSYSTMGDANFRSHFCFRVNGPVYQDSMGAYINHILEKVDCEGLPAVT